MRWRTTGGAWVLVEALGLQREAGDAAAAGDAPAAASDAAAADEAATAQRASPAALPPLRFAAACVR